MCVCLMDTTCVCVWLRAVQYEVGGVLRYLQVGEPRETTLDPDDIDVYPDPKLRLKYFWEREVCAFLQPGWRRPARCICARCCGFTSTLLGSA